MVEFAVFPIADTLENDGQKDVLGFAFSLKGVGKICRAYRKNGVGVACKFSSLSCQVNGRESIWLDVCCFVVYTS